MTTPVLQMTLLRDEASALEATFVPGAGMLCSSLRHRGEELLAQNAGVAAYARGARRWASRCCTRGRTASRASTTAPPGAACAFRTISLACALDQNGLPIHGVVAGLMAWEPTPADDRDRSRDALAAHFSWSDARPELFEVFPFRHELHYEAALRDGILEIEVTVDACGQDPVPLSFGFHPYLSPPGAARERLLVELPAMRPLALDAQQIPIGRAAGARAATLRAR